MQNHQLENNDTTCISTALQPLMSGSSCNDSKSLANYLENRVVFIFLPSKVANEKQSDFGEGKVKLAKCGQSKVECS